MDEYARMIDEAMNSYPLAPLPAGFTRRLMGHIQPARPVFRLSLLDWLLPAFFGLFGMSSVAAIWWTLSLLDPLWLPRLRLTCQLFLARAAVYPAWQSFAISLIVLLGLELLAGFAVAALVPWRNWVNAVD